MLLIETFLIFAIITVLLIISMLTFRDARHILQGKLLISLSISLAALNMTIIPPVFELSEVIYLTAKNISSFHLGLLGWFSLSLLKDDFRIGGYEWLGMVVFSCILSFI